MSEITYSKRLQHHSTLGVSIDDVRVTFVRLYDTLYECQICIRGKGFYETISFADVIIESP